MMFLINKKILLLFYFSFCLPLIQLFLLLLLLFSLLLSFFFPNFVKIEIKQKRNMRKEVGIVPLRNPFHLSLLLVTKKLERNTQKCIIDTL